MDYLQTFDQQETQCATITAGPTRSRFSLARTHSSEVM